MTSDIGPKIEDALGAIASSYGQRVEEFGPTAKAAGWRDEKTQHLRFAKLLEMIPGDNSVFSVADLGCGYGELMNALSADQLLRLEKYIGYDVSELMVAKGRELFAGNSKVSFVCSSVLQGTSDYVFASGIFNHHFGAPADVWKRHILSTIENMYQSCRLGIAFNIMTTCVDFREDYIYYADPGEILKVCLDSFGKHVRLSHDYELFEFTVYISKNRKES